MCMYLIVDVHDDKSLRWRVLNVVVVFVTSHFDQVAESLPVSENVWVGVCVWVCDTVYSICRHDHLELSALVTEVIAMTSIYCVHK